MGSSATFEDADRIYSALVVGRSVEIAYTTRSDRPPGALRFRPGRFALRYAEAVQFAAARGAKLPPAEVAGVSVEIADQTTLPAGTERVRAILTSPGSALAPSWQRDDADRPAWCEIVAYRRPGEGATVGAFGGRAWPSAWPQLFSCGPTVGDRVDVKPELEAILFGAR